MTLWRIHPASASSPAPAVGKVQCGSRVRLQNRIKGLCLTLSLLVLVLTDFARASDPQSTGQKIGATQDVYLKVYSSPVTKIRAGFIPNKAQLVWGEPVRLTFTVRNLGTIDFEFQFGGDYRGIGRHDRFKITGVDENGKKLADPMKDRENFGGFVQPVRLKSGELFTNVINLTNYCVIAKPGQYRFRCSFAFDEPFSLKQSTNPVVTADLVVTILERTPRRISQVLDEYMTTARNAHGPQLYQTLAEMAEFGKDDSVPKLAQLASDGSIELRLAALRALSAIPTDASLDVLLSALTDTNSEIRSAAAQSLGGTGNPRAVRALLDSLPKERPPVANAIVLALGDSSSDLAFPVITNILEIGPPELRRSAVQALANFGGSRAADVLKQHITTNFLQLRYQIVLALGERLHQPIDVGWLLPVLIGRELNHEWIDSLRLLRMYAGKQAIPAMLSCLDFDVAWSGRNWWILNEVRACPGAPPAEYSHDNNRDDGTLEEKDANLRTLQALRHLAGPVPSQVRSAAIAPIPYLKTDPPIDFAPTFKEFDHGNVEIKSGFLDLSFSRTGGNLPYTVSEPYKSVYRNASHFRSVQNDSNLCAQLKISPQQLQRLHDLLNEFAVKLCGPNVSDQKTRNLYQDLVLSSNYCPWSEDWHTKLIAYNEAPSALRQQARAELIDSVRVFSQNYHSGTVEFAKAAEKIFTASQLQGILRE